MKLTVFGATGTTGKLILDQGLHRGHHLTAFARDPATLGPYRDRVDVVTGDGTDPAAVTRAIAGRDAVIVAVSSKGSPTPIVATITKTIIDAMTAARVDRLVVVGSYGMVAHRPLLVAPMLRTILAKAFRDQARAEEHLAASNLHATVVRPTRLTNNPPSTRLQISTDPLTTGPFSVSRTDLASVLLDTVETDDTDSPDLDYLNITG